MYIKFPQTIALNSFLFLFMLIGQAGDKMYITECIVINKSFKIINNFNDINCMLMISNFNTNFICVLCWKNLLLFYQITSILVKFKSAKNFFFSLWRAQRLELVLLILEKNKLLCVAKAAKVQFRRTCSGKNHAPPLLL